MDRHQITNVVSERPGMFLLAMAVLAASLLGLGYYALANSHRDRAALRTGVTCTDWTYESPVEKHLDGPEAQQMCERYLASRSANDAQRDDSVWQQKIEAANARWENRKQ